MFSPICSNILSYFGKTVCFFVAISFKMFVILNKNSFYVLNNKHLYFISYLIWQQSNDKEWLYIYPKEVLLFKKIPLQFGIA
jgi:hypothetical protein